MHDQQTSTASSTWWCMTSRHPLIKDSSRAFHPMHPHRQPRTNLSVGAIHICDLPDMKKGGRGEAKILVLALGHGQQAALFAHDQIQQSVHSAKPACQPSSMMRKRGGVPPACAPGWRKEGSKVCLAGQRGMRVGSSSTTLSKVGSTATAFAAASAAAEVAKQRPGQQAAVDTCRDLRPSAMPAAETME